MLISKQDVMKAAGSLQACAGQKVVAKAAMQAVHDIFKYHTIEAILIHAEIAFNAINRKAMLHNISLIFPIVSTYISNCYNTPARLFINGGTEILSKARTTQGDPTAMAAYALGVTPLIQHLLEITSSKKLYSKEIAYTDDFTVAYVSSLMTLGKHNGLSNNLQYHFHLFTGPGDLLRRNSLFFGFIAFWVEESEK